MPLKINGSTSGSVTLAAPATGSDVTLTLPTTGFGKLLQLVRASDTTQRTTTSGSFGDVTGMSVTITPTKSDSIILVIATFMGVASSASSNNLRGYFAITDSANTTISGAQGGQAFGVNSLSGTGTRTFQSYTTLIAYATPGSTSAQTYKLRFASDDTNTTIRLDNNLVTGQMIAIEIGA